MVDENLDNHIPVFTQYEAYVLAYAVANALDDDVDFEEVTALIDDFIPQVLS